MNAQPLRIEADEEYIQASDASSFWQETGKEYWKQLAAQHNERASALNLQAAAMEASTPDDARRGLVEAVESLAKVNAKSTPVCQKFAWLCYFYANRNEIEAWWQAGQDDLYRDEQYTKGINQP